MAKDNNGSDMPLQRNLFNRIVQGVNDLGFNVRGLQEEQVVN